METQETKIEFPCPYSIEQKYEMAASGEYGSFEIYSGNGQIIGYRGMRKGYGTTGVYATYKLALEAAFTEFGEKNER